MAATRKLYIDTFTGRLTTSAQNGSDPGQLSFYQGDIIPIQIQLLEPDPTGGIGSYIKPDISNIALLFAVSDTPTGTASTPAPVVTQFTWTKDTTAKTFTADVAFNTAGVTTLIGTASSVIAYLEIQITEGSSITTVFQAAIILKAQIIEDATSSVAAGLTPISREEADAMYVKYISANGATITLPDENGVYALVLGCNTDGTVRMDIVTL